MTIHGIITIVKIYTYKGETFEFSGMSDPWPLRKNGERKKYANRKFWEIFDEFNNLPKEEKEKYKVQGGCLHF